MPKLLTQKNHSPSHAKVHKLELALIAILVLGITTAIIFGVIYLTQRNKSNKAEETVKQTVNLETVKQRQKTIKSKLGFEVTLDTGLFTAAATGFRPDGQSLIYEGDELFEPGNFALVNIYKPVTSNTSSYKQFYEYDQTELAISTNARADFFERRRQEFGQDISELDIVEKHFMPKDQTDITYQLLDKADVTIGGIEYRKITYQENNQRLQKLNVAPSKEIHYLTVQNSRPFALKIQGISELTENLGQYEAMVESVKYSAPAEDAEYISYESKESNGQNQRKFPLPLVAVYAQSEKSAATTSNTDIKVVARNMPATVKILAVNCADFVFGDAVANLSITNGCTVGSGSGFIISDDGYVATNGHVSYSSPASILAYLVASGNRDVLVGVIHVISPSLNRAEAEIIADLLLSDQGSINKLAKNIESQPEGSFQIEKEVSFYSVQIGDGAGQFNNSTTKPSEYLTYDEDNKAATFVAKNYNPYDLSSENGEFTASDVALLKIEGENYPVTSLGSIGSLLQGSELTVIGFPAIAEQVLNDTSNSLRATATKGIVSAVRDAPGNGKKLIQSDVAISGGNSGGPAFDSSGLVVGLATYGVVDDQGNNYNYMRDIQDLKDLVSENGVTLSSSSSVQSEWEKGLDNFLKAYYGKSIKGFEKVLAAYPQHVLAQQYIDIAKQKKASGEEAIDPAIYFGLGVVVLVLVGGGVVLLIVIKSHRKKLVSVDTGVGGVTSPSGINSTSQGPTAPMPPTDQGVNNDQMLSQMQAAGQIPSSPAVQPQVAQPPTQVASTQDISQAAPVVSEPSNTLDSLIQPTPDIQNIQPAPETPQPNLGVQSPTNVNTQPPEIKPLQPTTPVQPAVTPLATPEPPVQNAPQQPTAQTPGAVFHPNSSPQDKDKL